MIDGRDGFSCCQVEKQYLVATVSHHNKCTNVKNEEQTSVQPHSIQKQQRKYDENSAKKNK